MLPDPYEYFGLIEEPFTIAPNPMYMYLTPQHKEAIYKCQYVIKKKGGLAVVHGDVGTGKTTIARRLYHDLHDDTSYEVAMLLTPGLKTDTAFLRAILAEYGIPPKRSHAASLAEFRSYATGAFQHNKNLVLLIDEAQQMSTGVFLLLRDFLNFETDREKLIQIVLFGQNELAHKLNSDRLRAIKSRVGMYAPLSAITEKDIAEVINFRWVQAGGQDKSHPFNEDALTVLYELSQGLPRELNKLCHMSLLRAMMGNSHEVTPLMVQAAAQELQLNHKEA